MSECVPSSKSPSIQKHVCSELQMVKVCKMKREENTKGEKKLWHLIMAGTFSAEYYDVSVFNL